MFTISPIMDQMCLVAVSLIDNGAQEVDITLEDTERLGGRCLRIVVKRNSPQEGDDESTGKSD